MNNEKNPRRSVKSVLSAFYNQYLLFGKLLFGKLLFGKIIHYNYFCQKFRNNDSEESI